MNYGAFGLVEVVGSSNAILVIDQMLSLLVFLLWLVHSLSGWPLPTYHKLTR